MEKSVIVAVNAVDYTKGLLTKASQYSRCFVRKELQKFFVGIDQMLSPAAPECYRPSLVVTGRWGCGVFGADEHLKFCLQWIICSFCGVPMQFVTSDSTSRREMQIMARHLKDKSIAELLGLIEQYGKQKVFTDKGLLNYFKEYA